MAIFHPRLANIFEAKVNTKFAKNSFANSCAVPATSFGRPTERSRDGFKYPKPDYLTQE